MVQEGVIQLVFRSEYDAAMQAADAVAALRGWSAVHGARDLGGFALVGDRRITGLIEGPASEVLGRMEEIAADPVHTGMTVLREARAPGRRFASWYVGALSRPGDAGADPAQALFQRSLLSALRALDLDM